MRLKDTLCLARLSWIAIIVMTAVAVADAADRYWSGSGTWTTGGAGQWSATSGSGYGTSTWSDGDNAIFEGSVGTVTLGGDITASNLTFTTTSAGYVINGYTLNFQPGATIDQTGSNINHTITSAITGSPAVRIIDNQGASYKGIIFAPTNGTVTLGDCTVPYNVGSGDKGGIELSGTTTGNSVNSVTFEGGDRYADVRKTGSGTWSIGNVLIGTVRINGGTLVANGTIDTRYQNIQVNSGGILAYNNPGAALTTLQISGGSLDNTSGAAITNSTHNPPIAWNADSMFIGSQGANSDLYLGAGAVSLSQTRRITVSNALTTLTIGGVISGGRGIIKDGTGALTLSGANTFTAEAMVLAGTLALTNGNALGNSASLVIEGTGKVRLDSDETVKNLYIAGELSDAGTWGSSSSAAANQDDTYFSGTAVLTVTEGAGDMDLLLRDDFESGFSEWTAVDSAGYYTYSSGTDYSTTFDSAGRMTDGQIRLANPLKLASKGYTDVTISYNIRWNGPSGTRRLYCYFAEDGTNYVSLGYTANFQGRDSYSVNSGSYTFTDQAKFRIQMYDSGGPVVYADDVVITGSPAFVPPGLVLRIK